MLAASQKIIDSSNRLRYVRALERFHKSIISYLLNTPELSKKGFNKKTFKSIQVIKKTRYHNQGNKTRQ